MVSDSASHPRQAATDATIVAITAWLASNSGRSVRKPCAWVKPSNPSLSSTPIVATINGQPTTKPRATIVINSPNTNGMNHNSETTSGPTDGILANSPPRTANPHNTPKQETLIRDAESSDPECRNPKPTACASDTDSPRTTSAAVIRTRITPASDQTITATRNRDQLTAVSGHDSPTPTILTAGSMTSRNGRPASSGFQATLTAVAIG